MSFEEPKFGEQSVGIVDEEEPHSSLEREEELGGEVKKLKDALAEIAAGLKKENVPVDDECRIDAGKFKGVYSGETIQRDQEYVKAFLKKAERRKHPRVQLAEDDEEYLKKTGEKMEMLKTVIFNKFLGNDFLIVRTTKYDDFENKVDNFIVDRKTGVSICALDEIGENKGTRFERKRNKVLKKNKEENGGGQLKYGFRLEKGAGDAMRLIKGKVESLPLFYLALPLALIEKTIEQLDVGAEEPSPHEKKLFAYFVASLNEQIKLLEMGEGLNPELRRRASDFERIIKGVKI